MKQKKFGYLKIMNRSYSGFYRHLPLPKNVDADKADAEYKDGILTIKVPKVKVEEKKEDVNRGLISTTRSLSTGIRPFCSEKPESANNMSTPIYPQNGSIA